MRTRHIEQIQLSELAGLFGSPEEPPFLEIVFAILIILTLITGAFLSAA